MRRAVVVTIVTVCAGLLPAASALGAPDRVVVHDGVTQPAFGYADAVRERVWVVCSACDGDHDGTPDRIALDIMRPAATERGLKVPVLMDASPYFTTIGRGNEAEKIADLDGDGRNDRWPLFYDNYFVPRGYAIVLLDVDGTGNSTGCTDEGGRNDVLSAKAGIDWLNGRAKAYDARGNEVEATWHNGRSAMIGKSYDGTIANGVAATGVEGLTTIIPISAISSWYQYTRMGGVTFYDDYPAYLSEAVTNPDRRDYCAPSRALLSQNDGDESGDYTPFWAERNYRPDVSNVRASVFASHGINDDNVRPDHLADWWRGLSARHVPRKLWLSSEGHVDPFDYRRGAWVATLHRWLDHWLQGVPNGITREPAVDIERSADVWETHATWPAQPHLDARVWLRAGRHGGPGRLALLPGRNRPLSFQDDPAQSEATMIGAPDTVGPNRLVFLSGPLPRAARISGTPQLRLKASVDRAQTNLGAVLVDYGDGTHVTRAGDGVLTTTTATCWGESSATDDPCYFELTKPLVTVSSWAVSKGILDSSNRNSLRTAQPLVPGREHGFPIRLLPTDYVVAAGHRLGLVVVANYPEFESLPGEAGATVTVNTRRSRLSLPIAFGDLAAGASSGMAAPRADERSGSAAGTFQGAAEGERRIPR